MLVHPNEAYDADPDAHYARTLQDAFPLPHSMPNYRVVGNVLSLQPLPPSLLHTALWLVAAGWRHALQQTVALVTPMFVLLMASSMAVLTLVAAWMASAWMQFAAD